MKKVFLLLVLMSFSSALLADLDDFADYLEFSKCKQTINLKLTFTKENYGYHQKSCFR